MRGMTLVTILCLTSTPASARLRPAPFSVIFSAWSFALWR